MAGWLTLPGFVAVWLGIWLDRILLLVRSFTRLRLPDKDALAVFRARYSQFEIVYPHMIADSVRGPRRIFVRGIILGNYARQTIGPLGGLLGGFDQRQILVRVHLSRKGFGKIQHAHWLSPQYPFRYRENLISLTRCPFVQIALRPCAKRFKKIRRQIGDMFHARWSEIVLFQFLLGMDLMQSNQDVQFLRASLADLRPGYVSQAARGRDLAFIEHRRHVWGNVRRQTCRRRSLCALRFFL